MAVSKIRQNYQTEIEAAVNKQINIELYASYVYLSMSSYFDRDDVALSGAAKWFMEQSNEERQHAMELMKYQNERGGRVVFNEIKSPEKNEWGSLLEALEAALTLEKFNNTCLLSLHANASQANDPHLSDFLEEKFLGEQVEAIHHLGKMITNLKRAGSGLGEYLFDKEHFGH